MNAIGNISPTLTQTEKNFVIGNTHRKIREYSEKDLVKELNGLVTRTIQDCGQTVTAIEKTNLCASLAKDLKARCGNISIWDLNDAFRNGRLKDYGEWYGLNANTFTTWAMAYMASLDRTKAFEKQKRYEESIQDSAITVDELRKLELNERAAEFFYNEWRNNPAMKGTQLDKFKGFCIAHHDRKQLPFNQEYFDSALDAIIDSMNAPKLSRDELIRHKEIMAQIDKDPLKCKEVMSEYKFIYVKHLING